MTCRARVASAMTNRTLGRVSLSASIIGAAIMVVSFASTILPAIAFALALIATITGHTALRRMKHTRTGRGTALAGTIVGWCSTIMILVVAALVTVYTVGIAPAIDPDGAKAQAAADVPQVQSAIAPINDHGLSFTVSADSSCFEGCSGLIVITQTAGELTPGDVTRLHNAVQPLHLQRNMLSGNTIRFIPLDEDYDIPSEAGFCTSGIGFDIQRTPNPQCTGISEP